MYKTLERRIDESIMALSAGYFTEFDTKQVLSIFGITKINSTLQYQNMQEIYEAELKKKNFINPGFDGVPVRIAQKYLREFDISIESLKALKESGKCRNRKAHVQESIAG